MSVIRIGDIRPVLKELDPKTMNEKEMILAAFDSMTNEAQEREALEIARRQREVNEAAKKRF